MRSCVALAALSSSTALAAAASSAARSRSPFQVIARDVQFFSGCKKCSEDAFTLLVGNDTWQVNLDCVCSELVSKCSSNLSMRAVMSTNSRPFVWLVWLAGFTFFDNFGRWLCTSAP